MGDSDSDVRVAAVEALQSIAQTSPELAAPEISKAFRLEKIALHKTCPPQVFLVMLCIVPVVVVAVICVSLPLSLSLPLFDFLDRCGRHGVAQRHATALVACSIPIPDIGSRLFFHPNST